MPYDIYIYIYIYKYIIRRLKVKVSRLAHKQLKVLVS